MAATLQVQTSSSIVSDIDAHMLKSGVVNSGWCVGITSDIDERLFGYHRVPRKNHWFIYRRAASCKEARAIEAAYHKVGCKGSGGGGDDSSCYVYAYVITPATVE